MALGLGYGLPFAVKRPVQGFAEDVTLATNNALADAAQREEAGNCLTARAMQVMQDVQPQPSLLIVPQLYKAGVLYDQLPTTRTNFIPNNSMAGATGSVLPTTWASGSIPAGFTFSVGASGQATANDGTLVNYVDVSVSGTATASGAFNLFFSAATGAVTATTGQTFTLSAYATCISGDITTPAMVLQVQEVSGSTFQAGTSTNIALASGAVLQRLSAVRPFNQSGVTAARGRIGHPIVSGTTYSYTIRIASPQLERLGVATPMIATSTGAVTRLNESTNVVGLPPDFTVSRNTTATRVNSSGLIESVASGVPRIDWLGQSCPGLLVEPSGQNLCQRSEEFNNAFHFPFNLNAFGSGSVANTTATLDPYGTNVADYIQENSVSGVAHSIIDVFAGNVSGTTYTWSVFAKAAERTIINLFNNGGGGGSATFNLTTGVATLIVAGVSASMQNYGNGWWRCILTYTSTTTGNHNVQIRLCDAAGNTSYNGTGNQGAYIFGAQLETGSIATTYIPTTVAAVSRAADVISASGALVSGLIGQTEGTIYAEVDVARFTQNAIVSISDGTISNRIEIGFQSTTQLYAIVSVLGANNNFIATIPAVPSTGGVYKIALAYKANDYCFALNSTAVASTASRGVPSCNKVNLGSIFNNTSQLNDRIRAAALYTTRLTDAQLAELTRL